MARRRRIDPYTPDIGKPRCMTCLLLGLRHICLRDEVYDAVPWWNSSRTTINAGERILNPQTYHCSAWVGCRIPGTVDDLIGYDGEAA